MRNPNEVMRAKCLQRKMGKNLARFSLGVFTFGPAQANERTVTKAARLSISMRAVLLAAAEHTHRPSSLQPAPSTKNAKNGPMQCEICIAGSLGASQLARSPLNAAFGLWPSATFAAASSSMLHASPIRPLNPMLTLST